MPTNKSFIQLPLYVTPEIKEFLRRKAYQEHRSISDVAREILRRAAEEEVPRDPKSPVT